MTRPSFEEWRAARAEALGLELPVPLPSDPADPAQLERDRRAAALLAFLRRRRAAGESLVSILRTRVVEPRDTYGRSQHARGPGRSFYG